MADAAARVGAGASVAVSLVERAEELGLAATGGLAARVAKLCARQGDADAAEALALATRARAALMMASGVGGAGGAQGVGSPPPPAMTRNQATDIVRAVAGAGGAAEAVAAELKAMGKLGPMAERIAAGGSGGGGGEKAAAAASGEP